MICAHQSNEPCGHCALIPPCRALACGRTDAAIVLRLNFEASHMMTAFDEVHDVECFERNYAMQVPTSLFKATKLEMAVWFFMIGARKSRPSITFK